MYEALNAVTTLFISEGGDARKRYNLWQAHFTLRELIESPTEAEYSVAPRSLTKPKITFHFSNTYNQPTQEVSFTMIKFLRNRSEIEKFLLNQGRRSEF